LEGPLSSVRVLRPRSGEVGVIAESTAARDTGRPSVGGEVEVRAGAESAIDVAMEKASRIVFDVTDGAVPGKKCPLKAQIIGLGLTPDPDLGSPLQAHGCANQYHAENGWFEVQVPPGEYMVVLTRGIEYSHREVRIKVEPGKDSVVAAELRRIVDTAGRVSTDFHSHSTPSGDNYCGTDDRVINLAAEHIEFAATTEHNRFYDWAPHIRRLGLADEMSTAVGIELTGSGAHFNAFPFRATRWAQDGGAPTWQKDPRLNAIVLRDFQGGGPDRYVQLNHPQVGEFFRDRNADGVPDGGFRGLEHLIDAAEVWSEEILNPEPWLIHRDRTTGKETPYQNRTFAWLQLLNQGRFLHVVAVSDAHSVFTNGAGGWRTYVPSSTDDPARIDPRELVRNARAGRMIVTNGPYLEVALDDGTLPGGHARRSGTAEIDVKVQCTDWIEIDRVQVLVNGRRPPDLDFTRAKNPEMFGKGVVKFRRRIAVPLAEDAHLIVAAVGEGHSLRTGYGRAWQAAMRPTAFSNPIFIDTDGDGFEPNGDTLGHPLPTAKKP
ncbi:MAG: CehA/McbA family metallohydrolase, partial [bacterium]